MKRIIIALAAVAMAFAVVPASAKKKVENKKSEQKPVQLLTSSDSLSYAIGMSQTQGLLPYISQNMGVDSAHVKDFIRGLEDFIKNSGDKSFKAYAAGLEIGSQLTGQIAKGIGKELDDCPDSLSVSMLCQGFVSALKEDTTFFDMAAAQEYTQERMAYNKKAKADKLYGSNRTAGETFLAENAKKEGVVVLPSGLQYKVLVKGNGEVPQKSSRVKVKYEGRLIDGTVFDSTEKHGGNPATFRADQVIKGWTEALTMMPVGSKWQLFIPQDMAYGERDMGQIKPFSTLIFDVELIGIEK